MEENIEIFLCQAFISIIEVDDLRIKGININYQLLEMPQIYISSFNTIEGIHRYNIYKGIEYFTRLECFSAFQVLPVYIFLCDDNNQLLCASGFDLSPMVTDSFRKSRQGIFETETFQIALPLQDKHNNVLGNIHVEFAVRHFSQDPNTIFCYEELPEKIKEEPVDTIGPTEEKKAEKPKEKRKFPRVNPRNADLYLLNLKYLNTKDQLISQVRDLENQVKRMETSRRRKIAQKKEQRKNGLKKNDQRKNDISESFTGSSATGTLSDNKIIEDVKKPEQYQAFVTTNPKAPKPKRINHEELDAFYKRQADAANKRKQRIGQNAQKPSSPSSHKGKDSPNMSSSKGINKQQNNAAHKESNTIKQAQKQNQQNTEHPKSNQIDASSNKTTKNEQTTVTKDQSLSQNEISQHSASQKEASQENSKDQTIPSISQNDNTDKESKKSSNSVVDDFDAIESPRTSNSSIIVEKLNEGIANNSANQKSDFSGMQVIDDDFSSTNLSETNKSNTNETESKSNIASSVKKSNSLIEDISTISKDDKPEESTTNSKLNISLLDSTAKSQSPAISGLENTTKSSSNIDSIISGMEVNSKITSGTSKDLENSSQKSAKSSHTSSAIDIDDFETIKSSSHKSAKSSHTSSAIDIDDFESIKSSSTSKTNDKPSKKLSDSDASKSSNSLSIASSLLSKTDKKPSKDINSNLSDLSAFIDGMETGSSIDSSLRNELSLTSSTLNLLETKSDTREANKTEKSQKLSSDSKSKDTDAQSNKSNQSKSGLSLDIESGILSD